MKIRQILVIGLAALCTSCAHETAGIDKGDIRIAWDRSTYREITEVNVLNADYPVEQNLYYPRAKHLSDGSILLSFENDHYGWDIYSCKSFDGGRTWTDATLVRHSYSCESSKGEDKKVFVNPDFYQLSNGRILLAWQWRYKAGYSDIPNTNQNCGVEMVISDDMGRTWSEAVEIYRGRCWEPAFLELPSGEIQMYITDSQEIRNNGSYSCTSLIRSFDGGKTWQGRECARKEDVEPITRTKYKERGMGGMPTAQLLNDGRSIVVPIEIWSGVQVYDISPVIIRSEDNWRSVDGQSIRENGGPAFPWMKQVSRDVKAFGPYSCKLNSGEIVVQANGQYKGQSGMWTMLGDSNADNFNLVTCPFPKGYWGSIDQINDNELISTATVAYKPDSSAHKRGKLSIIRGWLNRSREITCGSLQMQELESFDPQGLWLLGKEFDSKVYADFGYDRDSLYFGSYVFDTNLSSNSPENSDACQILLSRAGKGIYKITSNAAGDYTVYQDVNYSWKPLAWELGKAVTEVAGTVNTSGDADCGYSARTALPWSMLGGKPSRNEVLRIHMRHIHKFDTKIKSYPGIEETEGESSDYPGEWLSVTLK